MAKTKKEWNNENRLTIRIAPELRKKLEALAAARKWTLSFYINDVLTEHANDTRAPRAR
jgi:predicted HicB family RNase H-like nuclease